MDKLKTLEVLRGMKFMQRKEEAKRRATYEHQRYQSLHQLVAADGKHSIATAHTGERTTSSSLQDSQACIRLGGTAVGHAGASLRSPLHSSLTAVQRPTILYDAVCPMTTYAHARRRFDPHRVGTMDTSTADTIVASSPSLDVVVTDVAHQSHTTEYEEEENSISSSSSSAHDVNTSAPPADDTQTHAPDPTAVDHHVEEEHTHKAVEDDVPRSEVAAAKPPRRFYVDESIRAPKMPKRLREAVQKENRTQKKKRRGNTDDV